MESFPVASSKLTENKTMVSWKVFAETIFNNFENEEFDFSHISQMNITVIAYKMDMIFDFYMQHNMHMIEWQLDKLFKKDKSLIYKFPQNLTHPLNRKCQSSRI